MAVTYDLIASQTLASSAASITFSSIAASWTDLRLVLTETNSGTTQVLLRFNGDTATNYSYTILAGNGTTASSGGSSTINNIALQANYAATSTIPAFVSADIFSYAGSTYKTVLVTNSADQNGTGGIERITGTWRSTAAITSVVASVSFGTLSIGTTAQLYGIKAA